LEREIYIKNTKAAVVLFILYLGIYQITSVYANINQEKRQEPMPPSYSAASVLVMEASTGMVLYAANASEIKYPASITKIMTALIVLEHTTDFDERISFSDRAVFSIPRTSSHIAMDVGETLSIYEALYGLMLESANEVSLALAEHVSGSIEEFVNLMNRRARSLGAYDTYFVNPSGLPGAGHVSTAYDMALIMREAIRHPLFVDIIRARRFDIPPTERQPEVRALRNTNRLIHEGPYFNEYVVGSKTGWTTAAGHTLVTYARQNGRRLIVSILGGDVPGTFVDTTTLLNYGFAIPFEPVKIFDAAANVPTVPIFKLIENERTEAGRVPLQASNNLYYDLPESFDTSLLRYEFFLPQGLALPVEEGTVLGNVAVYVDDFRLGSALLRAAESVQEYVVTTPAAAEGYMPQPYSSLGYYDYTAESGSYYSYATHIWQNEVFLTLVVPLVISATTLIISLFIHFAKRKQRLRRKLHTRYARYPDYYRYK